MGFCVQLYVIGWNPTTPLYPPSAFGLLYEGAIGQPDDIDRRHLFVTSPGHSLFNTFNNCFPEMDFLDINLIKGSSLSLHAPHSPFYWRIL